MFNGTPIEIENLTKRFAYDNQNRPLYIGSALPGTPEDQPGWNIQKYEYNSDGNPDAIKLAVGELGRFNHVWDNRATLNYA